MQKNILLLTATVQPRAGQDNLAVADPTLRLAQYASALSLYVAHLKCGNLAQIIFAENSAHDLSSLKTQFDHPGMEWISYEGLDYPAHYHRGYGEFRLIDHVVAESEVLRRADPEDKVWKVTGRYRVANLGRVIRSAPARFDVYCDASRDWAEMSVMAWSVRGYELHLRRLWPSFATAEVPERVLARALFEHASNHAIRTRMAWPPYLVGTRGADGSSFEGRFGRLRHALRVTTWLARSLVERRIDHQTAHTAG